MIDTLEYRSIFTRLHTDLSILQISKPILIKYDSDNNQLIFYQTGAVVYLGYINFIYMKKSFKYGILLPEDYNKLMDNLDSLIRSNLINERTFILSPRKLSTKVFITPTGTIEGPIEVMELEFTSITTNWIIILKSFFNRNLRNSLKLIRSLDRKSK